MVKFLHAADLHLGLRITRFPREAVRKITEARYEAFDILKSKAREVGAHFIVLAGDVFDDLSVGNDISTRFYSRLERGGAGGTPCPVYILPGNHDPLAEGGVWFREPWASLRSDRTVLLREPVPVEVPGTGAVLLPCPLRSRTGVDDPTAWIADWAKANPRHDDPRVRIGVAHGSLNILPDLPADDHLIPPDTADRAGLDYLALGHWHKLLQHKSPDGAVRTVYPGTPEPMQFPSPESGGSDRWDGSVGWSSYSRDGNADRFLSAGAGTAVVVEIPAPGAAPVITPVEVGRLRWRRESVALNDDAALGALISRLAQDSKRDLTLLRLRVTGVLDAEGCERVANELAPVVEGRYLPGSQLDAADLHVRPDDGALRKAAGDGVLKVVLDRLLGNRKSAEENLRTALLAGDAAGAADAEAKSRLAEHALRLLYRIAREGAK